MNVVERGHPVLIERGRFFMAMLKPRASRKASRSSGSTIAESRARSREATE